MSDADFWLNQERAQGVVEKMKAIKAVLHPWEAFEARLEDAQVLLELADEQDDEGARGEVEEQAAALTADLGSL